jgi:hypothetical protein
VIILVLSLAACMPPEMAKLQQACESGNLNACSTLAAIRAQNTNALLGYMQSQQQQQQPPPALQRPTHCTLTKGDKLLGTPDSVDCW